MSATHEKGRIDIARTRALVDEAKDRAFHAWKPIEPTATAVGSTCLNCPPRPRRLNWRYNPHPGFGVVSLLRDGVFVASSQEKRCLWTMRLWREMANADPEHEWAIQIESPMTGVRYTRQSDHEWIATHRNPGFA